MRSPCLLSLVLIGLVTAPMASGCAKKIQVQKLQSGEVDICGISKVGIGSFKTSANKVAPTLASTIVGKLTQGIANEKQLEFFARDSEELGKIAREIEQFHDKGSLTQRSLAALQGAGLEGIIFGDITAATLTDSERDDKIVVDDKTGRYVLNKYRLRTGDLTVNFKMVDVRPDSPCGTLKTIVAQSTNETGTWEVLISGDAAAVGIGNAVNSGVGALLGQGAKDKSPVVHKVSQLPTEVGILDGLAEQSVERFLKKIQPHMQKGSIGIKSASTPKGELGIGYAMNCNWDQAEKTLEEAVKESQATAADYYNLAVVKDLKGCHREATQLMGRAVDLDPSDAEAVAAHAKLLDKRELGDFQESFSAGDLITSTSKDVCPIKVACGTEAPPGPAPTATPRCVTIDSMTVRASGSRDAKAIKTFPKGTELTVSDDASNPSWTKVYVEQGGKSYAGWGFKKSYECKTE
ncbi:MAG: hypothetical protein U0610_31275 [bacterium]